MLPPLEGYFIFYEQNEDMQSYLIAVHQNQPGETVQEVRPRAVRSPEKSRRVYESTAEPPEEKETASAEPPENQTFSA